MLCYVGTGRAVDTAGLWVGVPKHVLPNLSPSARRLGMDARPIDL
jgi:hypothetical protein